MAALAPGAGAAVGVAGADDVTGRALASASSFFLLALAMLTLSLTMRSWVLSSRLMADCSFLLAFVSLRTYPSRSSVTCGSASNFASSAAGGLRAGVHQPALLQSLDLLAEIDLTFTRERHVSCATCISRAVEARSGAPSIFCTTGANSDTRPCASTAAIK